VIRRKKTMIPTCEICNCLGIERNQLKTMKRWGLLTTKKKGMIFAELSEVIRFKREIVVPYRRAHRRAAVENSTFQTKYFSAKELALSNQRAGINIKDELVRKSVKQNTVKFHYNDLVD